MPVASDAIGVGDEAAAQLGLPTVTVPASGGALSLPRIVTELGFAPSTSEAARQVKAGGVKVNGQRVADLKWTPPGRGRFTIVVGGRKVGLIWVE